MKRPPVFRDVPFPFCRGAVGCAAALALSLVCSSSHAATVDFTTGYTTGSLSQQNGWSLGNEGAGHGDFLISSGVGLNINAGTGNGAAREFAYAPASSSTVGSVRTLTLNFSFSETSALLSGTSGNVTNILGLGLGEYVNDVPRLSVNFGRVAGSTDQYAIKLGYSNGTPVVTGPTSVLFSASALGLDFTSGDTTSDALQLAFLATPTTSYTNWSITGLLTNVATGQSFSFSNTLTTTAFWNLNYYNTISNGLSADAAKVVGVNNVLATTFGAPVAVPEPSASLLLAMGALCFAGFRGRRLKRQS